MLCVGAFALAACGGGGSSTGTTSTSTTTTVPHVDVSTASASQIVSAMEATVRGARSVTVRGRLVQGLSGESFDITTLADGDLSGTLDEKGVTLHVVSVQGIAYVDAGADFWVASGVPSAIAGAVGGHWITLTKQESTSLTSGLGLSELAKGIASGTSGFGKGAIGDVGGSPALGIETGKGGTIWVPLSGPLYPLEATGLIGSSTRGTLSFTGWNAAAEPKPPAGAKPLSSFINHA